jgi:hypothetical protein
MMQMDTLQILLVESCFLIVNRMCADNGGRVHGGRVGYDPQPNDAALPEDAPGIPIGPRANDGVAQALMSGPRPACVDREAAIFDLNVPQYIIMLQCQNTLQLQQHGHA